MTKNHTKTLAFTTLGIPQRKEIDDYQNVYSVNPLYLHIDHAGGYVEKEGANKYLAFDSTDQNKKLLRKYNDVRNRIKNKVNEVSDSEFDYEKDYLKSKFGSDDNLPLNKPLKFHLMTITIRRVFEEDGRLYPRIFLDDSLYELKV